MLELNLFDEILEEKSKALKEESCAMLTVPEYISKQKDLFFEDRVRWLSALNGGKRL